MMLYSALPYMAHLTLNKTPKPTKTKKQTKKPQLAVEPEMHQVSMCSN